MYTTHDIDVVQGDHWDGEDFTLELETDGVPFNSTGYTWKLTVKGTLSDEPLLELVGGDGLDITDNPFLLALNVDTTITTLVGAGVYVYDLERTTSGGHPKTILGGKFRVAPEVSQ